MRLLLNRAQSALAGSAGQRPARSAGLHASTARGGLEHARPRGRGHAIESKRGVNKSTHARIYRSSENSEHFRHTSLLKPSRLWGARCTVQGAGRCSHLHYPLLPQNTASVAMLLLLIPMFARLRDSGGVSHTGGEISHTGDLRDLTPGVLLGGQN
jgi:hypothetical protein